MSFHLIFLFLFQSGLAFAFSYFIAKIVLTGCDEESLPKLRRGLRWIALLTLACSIALPPVMFFAYYKALPEGKPANIALWPAVWIFMILGAVVLALSLVIWKSGRQHSAQ
ncbi:hypothetical protein G0Q06_00175 [Puniceicoccales bacterium CK1056]|uniref:Uncharacterized protein n=1 Tax=Oceanipulchritudo coccoides TaxID=2706888 RepID=A0A6B2LWS3_9BACT|nr:hypothetical protein [Oceanipulchritudo coccoides]NDV60861.1 hypothetical protein [Oceanipulchritudo coccoides]